MCFPKKVFLAVLLLLLPFCWGCPSLSAQQRTECDKIVSAWESIEPYPYVWGGESKQEGGYDCSGAIHYIQKAIGKPVPRTTAAKYYIMAAGKDKHWNQANCGDWIWWQFSVDRPYGHIGMHTRKPHAWQSGSSTGPTEIKLFEDGYWDKRFKSTKKPCVQ